MAGILLRLQEIDHALEYPHLLLQINRVDWTGVVIKATNRFPIVESGIIIDRERGRVQGLLVQFLYWEESWLV